MHPNAPDPSTGSPADAPGAHPDHTDRPSTEHPADPNNEPAPGSGQLRKPGDRYDQPGQGAELTPPDSQREDAMRTGAARDAGAEASDLHLPSPPAGTRHSDVPLSGLSAQDAAAGRPVAEDAPTHRGPPAP